MWLPPSYAQDLQTVARSSELDARYAADLSDGFAQFIDALEAGTGVAMRDALIMERCAFPQPGGIAHVRSA
jgi:hypothetical protein